MGDKSTIEWTDATWNPVRGCSRVSEGCRNCYAERVAARFSGPGQAYEGLAEMTPSGPRWTGEVRLIEERLEDPLRWKKPRRIFVNSMSDLFHESLSDEAIDKVFAVMALCPQHTFQILTKRAERMQRYLSNATLRVVDVRSDKIKGTIILWPLPNVWLGVSVENQQTADERIPQLLQTPAAVRWVSYEPALGPVSFADPDIDWEYSDQYHNGDWDWLGHSFLGEYDSITKMSFCKTCGNKSANPMHRETREPYLDWVVVGGESGPGARPFDVQWARDVIAQCKAAGVPVFVKQLGAQPYREGALRQNAAHEGPGTHREHTPIILKDKKGGDINEWPLDLRVREYPRAQP